MQLIYGGKTNMSLPKFEFPKTFSLNVNEKHFSNSTESIKFLEKVIIAYVDGTRANLTLLLDQQALLVFDAFGVQTDEVINLLDESNMFICNIPLKMAHLFQPQDLTLNKNAKDFTEQTFLK